MNRSVKTLALITISLFVLNVASSQLKLNAGSSVATDVKKVIEDYPNNFSNLTGDVIIQNPQSTDYRCNFKVTGAEESFITRYAAGKKPIVSWEALMLTTEDFETAKKKFKTLYSQLNNLAVAGSRLKGTYEAPAEGTDFTTVVFSFDPKEESTKKIRVELIMEAQMMDWKVKILVYDRDRNDDERGPIVED
jgi:hypothetical protein